MAKPVANDTFPRTVLVVDDEQAVLDVLSAVLKKHGLPCRTALSGEEAIELLTKERFGCVLTDKNLPGKSGLEVIRVARKLHPWCACLMMTAYPNTESVLEALRLGAADYLEKPFADLKLVVQKLASCMEHSRTAFERSALVSTLKEMQTQLEQTKEQSFKQQTELDVFAQVLDVKVEDAKNALEAKVHELDHALGHSKALSDKLSVNVDRVSEQLRGLANRALRESQRGSLKLDDARTTLKELAGALEKAVTELKG